MHTTGVVSHHAAERATAVAGRIGAEGQIVLLRSAAQIIENNAWLDSRDPALGIKFQNLRHVLGEIEYDGDIAALPGKRSPAATAEDRCSMLAANRDRRDYVVRVFGKHHADRHLPVVRSICGVKGAAPVVKADFAADIPAQRGFEGSGVCEGCRVFRHHKVFGWIKDSTQQSALSARKPDPCLIQTSSVYLCVLCG